MADPKPTAELESAESLTQRVIDAIESAYTKYGLQHGTNTADSDRPAFHPLPVATPLITADRLAVVRATLAEVARRYEYWNEAVVDPAQFVRALDAGQTLKAITRREEPSRG